MQNPFLCDSEFPLFDQMSPENADEALTVQLAEANAAVEALEQNVQADWAGFVRPLYDACQPLMRTWGRIQHLNSVMNSDAWRALIEKHQTDLVMFGLRVTQSPVFFEAYSQVKTDDPVQRRILDKTIQSAKLAGVGLTGEAKEEFNKLSAESATLANEFANHVLDATKEFSLTLRTAEELDGLPASFVEEVRQEDGACRITLETSVYVPFMKYSKNRAAREQLHKAYVVRAAEPNTPVIEQLLANRRRTAELLGYHNFAEVSLSQKMAGTVARVDELLEKLLTVGKPHAVREDEELKAFANQPGEFEPWDVSYWAERMLEAKYAYDEETLRQYFQFPQVLDGLFTLAERLFGIRVEAADGVAPVWHPDVRFFQVKDEHGQTMAYFYLDPYSRPETKMGGAWMNEFQTRDAAGPALKLPIGVLVCNQSRPINGKPSLMRFEEVTTLFHEFGHVLQHLLTTVDEPEASGINGIEWDAVEIASQFLENFCYDAPTLKSLSKHIETGAQLPDELFAKVKAARNYRAGSALLRQLYFAMTDLELYARYPQDGLPNANAVKEKIGARVLVKAPPAYDRFLCAFSHIFGGGYAAGYYSYKWSEVLAADVFGAFEEAEALGEEALQTCGRRYRDTFLALGGGTPPDQVFRHFRHREPTIDALLRQSGLAPRAKYCNERGIH